MLTLNLRELFRSKGIPHPISWMMKRGITNRVAVKLLNDDFKRGTPVHHLATICEELNCTLDDMFVWTPSTAVVDRPDHPLQKLKKKPGNTTVPDLLKILPPGEIEEVKKFIEQKLREGKPKEGE